MNREIKFRGQTRRKGEYLINMAGDKCEANWVYGGIFPQNNGGDFAIIYEQPSCEKRVVYSDTAGQYIGVKDKNGKEIYEGDIVEHQNDIFVVEYVDEFASYTLRHPTNMRYAPAITPITSKRMCVIGNVYENADLLKEAGNE